jgi:23S rRNA pseudouridine1911/1915/1917 synthase
MDILYEDNHLLVVNKPAGLLTQASGTSEANLEDLAKAWIKEHYHKPGNVYLHAVHRLDRPASGCVLLARTSKALSRLQAAMRSKDNVKCYYAIVCGHPSPAKALLEHFLCHKEHHAEVVDSKTPGAQAARLIYRVVTQNKEFSLVDIALETGRYHQIRVQMQAIDCPILGDTRYGGASWRHSQQIALHHYLFEFTHPVTKERLAIKAPVPAHWPLQPL